MCKNCENPKPGKWIAVGMNGRCAFCRKEIVTKVKPKKTHKLKVAKGVAWRNEDLIVFLPSSIIRIPKKLIKQIAIAKSSDPLGDKWAEIGKRGF